MEKLLKQAAVIRDEMDDNKNTAERVGTLFVDVIQQIQKIVLEEQAKIDSLKITADAESVKLSFNITDESGEIISKKILFPIVSDKQAGILTSPQLNDINQRIKKITPLLITEAKFNELKESGKLDSEKIYYVYEEE